MEHQKPFLRWLVVLSLFSENVTTHQKQLMAKSLKKYAAASSTVGSTCDNQCPILTSRTQLKDLVGPNSFVLFELIKIKPDFLEIPAKDWEGNPSFINIKGAISHLKVTNDTAERALGLVTTFNDNTITKDPEQKQFLYRVVYNLRKQQSMLKKNTSEGSSKTILSQMKWY